MSAAQTPKPHERYYLKDGVNFLVENTLFKVPRYLLESSSPILAEMILEASSAADASSTSILLPNVTSSDFEHLLAFLYPLSPPIDTPSAPFSPPQWIAILRLSTRFRMAALHTLAMRLLSVNIADPLTKIRLGREYEYTPWMREGFVRLCLREEMVSIEEAEGLTKEEVVKCARAREEIRKRHSMGRGSCRLGRGSELALSSTTHAGMDGLDDHPENGRAVLLIVDETFGFPHNEEESEVKVDQLTTRTERASCADFPSGPWKWDQTWHWPSDLHLRLPSTTRLLWFISPSALKEDWKRSIHKLKIDVPDSASMTAVEEAEKYWLCDVISKAKARELSRNINPVSVSIALGVVGALVLIPQLT